jgi:hypothetical protein
VTPALAGRLCERLDESLRGSETNLSNLAGTIVVVLRDEAWRRRTIRTGEIVECSSFLDMLTAPPLRGFGEDPKRVEALLKEDAEALRMFRAATTAPNHRPLKTTTNRSSKPKHGTTRAYTLERLHRDAPALYADVVAGRLSANQAAIRAGFRRQKSTLDQLQHWWKKATAKDRAAFDRWRNP